MKISYRKAQGPIENALNQSNKFISCFWIKNPNCREILPIYITSLLNLYEGTIHKIRDTLRGAGFAIVSANNTWGEGGG